jgi:hypothetical protein
MTGRLIRGSDVAVWRASEADDLDTNLHEPISATTEAWWAHLLHGELPMNPR